MLAEQSSHPIVRPCPPSSGLAMNKGYMAEQRGLHEDRGDIQIPSFKPLVRDDDSVVSGSSDSQMKKRVSVDMSKEQVEELVRKVTIDEMKTKWFDEIFAKVKSELVEHSPTETPSSSEPPSPKSIPVETPKPYKTAYQAGSSDSCKTAFQATVEDETERPMTQPFDSAIKAHRPSLQPQSNRSSVVSGSSPVSPFVSEPTSSKVSNLQSSRPKSIRLNEQLRTPNESPQPSPKSRPSVRFSDEGPVILNGRSTPTATRQAETAPASRLSRSEVNGQGVALSAVDQKWGKLFDGKGGPTARLGQVLRGIANYLIAEYSPHNSLVVTPEKLKAFYSTYKLESEAFPFQQIFDCRPHGALDNLESLYQELHCENHLVQRRPSGMPHIPALTPSGFERWMVCQIQAFPDHEARRLNRVIADLPITADGALVDGKPERLPKQLSRHLFPTDREQETHDLVVDAISHWIKIAEENETAYRRSSFDETPKPLSSREDGAERYKPDEYRTHDSSKYRRASRDDYKPSSRVDPPTNRFITRINSDSTVRPSKDSCPSPAGSSQRSRSPVSNRYRHSSSTVDSGTSASDGHDMDSPSHRGSHPSNRRNRDKEYRYREPKASTEAAPRSLGRRDTDRRHSQIIDGGERDPNGLTYDEYLRSNPRAMRNSLVDDGGYYRTPHSSGVDQRTR
ncbi:hypothetical protein FZEAL_6525 [Fusarium zealandicum]|uniref:DUF7514 domain-containing protein n=1 Tax=Fusarium zealandicum TaxID=1053134 RepID=A0A8H4UIE7_9HYPO|nr:hypothetical protein FZEAL_6525 [Fusarium zealandicum]